MSFDEWMEKVEELMEEGYGVSIHDLPDQQYRDCYDSGIGPSEMIQMILVNEGLEDE